METVFNKWMIRIAGLLGGCVIWAIFSSGQYIQLSWVYEKVGITIIALLPLSAWALWVAVKSRSEGSDITLAYIGTTSQRVGLLGTVIGIVAATVSIGQNLSSGAAGAVTNALPAVGQALVSTAVGFVIAIICDFFRYIHAQGEEA